MMISLRSTRWWTGIVLTALSVSFLGTPLFAKKAEPRPRIEVETSEDEDEESSKKGAKDYQTKVETPLIGEYVNFAGLNPIRIRGVGLVVGLSGTGGDPAPSPLRTALLEDLKRRNIPNPNRIISSPDTALVEVWAFLPPLMEKGETLDVYVQIPESAEATSLHGGWLMETYLSEQAFVPGKGVLNGNNFARAKGPILIGTADSEKATSAQLIKGRVLGGGTVMRERELSIFLKNDFRGARNAIRISDVISKRFHDYDKHGISKPMAEPKNDQKIVLTVHPRYKENFPRYLQVIRHMAFKEQQIARQVRLNRLKEELQVPEKCEKASLQLEAVGKIAIPILKSGLESPLLECRFQAASALAYLGEPDGIAALKEAVQKEPAFRVFALAALSSIEDGEAHLALRQLMEEQSMETKYGSFRALWVLDKDDPFIRGDLITAMSGKTGFMLHVLETKGEPLVHLMTRTRPEVVLFGAEQQFSTPLYLSAGKHIMVTAQPGSQKVAVTRFEPDRDNLRREVSLNVEEVIRAVAELDGTYPDVVQMLTEASQQHNLAGRFTTDALPEAGRMYERPAVESAIPSRGSRKIRIGRENQSPNIFPAAPDENKTPEKDEDVEESSGAMANIADDRPPSKPGSDTKKSSGKRKESKRDSGLSTWFQPRVHHFSEDDKPSDNTEPSSKSEPTRKSEPPSKIESASEPPSDEKPAKRR
ncbi:MAG: flagellar basal body P-ring protein FlgI [Planctomycetaceae bacterium]